MGTHACDERRPSPRGHYPLPVVSRKRARSSHPGRGDSSTPDAIAIGAGIGAALGDVVPGIATVIGALIGAGIGAAVGRLVDRSANDRPRRQ